MDLDKFIKVFIIPLCLIIAAKQFLSNESDTPIHKGDGYQITKPLNWKKDKGFIDPGFFINRTDVDKVSFYDPLQTPRQGLKPNNISVFAAKMEQAVWVDMVFPEIKKTISFNSKRIIDSGKFNIGNGEGEWIIYEDAHLPMWHLEFFFADEKNGFYKIRCSCDEYHFKEFSKICEETKQSFVFSYTLF